MINDVDISRRTLNCVHFDKKGIKYIYNQLIYIPKILFFIMRYHCKY